MSFLRSSSTPAASTQQALSGVPIQTSAYGGVVPVCYGTNRLAGNLIMYGDFQTVQQNTPSSGGGKGGLFSSGSSSTTSYTYYAAFAFALCEGPIAGLTGKVWQSKTITTLSDLGFSAFTGTYPQSPWGYWSTSHPEQELGYSGFVYVAAGRYSLGDTAQMPSHTFELTGVGLDGAVSATDCASDVVTRDILTNPHYGVGFASSRLASLDNYRNYTIAAGLLIAPAYTEQKSASDHLAEIAQVTNSEFVWSSGTLSLVPYGDENISGNGHSYTAPTAPLYDLTDDDFLPNGDDGPVKILRKRPADLINALQVECLDRTKDYVATIVEAKNQAAIDAYGLRQDSAHQQHIFCDPSAARVSAQLQLQRAAVANTYTFQLDQRFVLLDPMDIVSITDAGLGIDRMWVRIVEIEEGDDGALAVTAEEYLAGAGGAAIYSTQPTGGWSNDYGADPGNATAPVFFEPVAEISGGFEVWIATAGGADWGGATVWVSTDGASYSRAGEINGKARVGVLGAALPDLMPTSHVVAVDETNTLRVDLAQSGGQLASGTSSNALARDTLAWVDGEYISYSTATLVSGNTYDLSYLVRGGYGTSSKAHASGASFVRLDGSVFRLSYAEDRIGQTIWVKLTSFNAYKGGQQSLADVDAHTYTIEGVYPIVTTKSLEEGLRDYVTSELKRVSDRLVDFERMIAAASAEQDAANWLDKKDVRTDIIASSDRAQASISEVETVAVNANLAVVSLSATVTATFAAQTVLINQTSTAIATVDGKLLGTWQMAINASGYISGMKAYNDGSTSAFVISADVLQFGWPGSAAPTPVFQIANVNGVAKLAFRGDMFADGSFTARTIATHSLTSDQIAIGGVDLINIIDGAVTGLAYALPGDVVLTIPPTGAPGIFFWSGSQSVNLASAVLDVKKGSLLIDGYFRASFATYPGPCSVNDFVLYIDLKINGATVKSIAITPVAINSTDLGIAGLFPVLHVMTGIGAIGVAVFTMTARFPAARLGATTNFSFTLYDILLRVSEPRR